MKILSVSIGILLLSFQGLSQSSKTDSTVIANSQLKIALKKIEQGKLDAQQLALQIRGNEILRERLLVKDSIIATYQQKEKTDQQLQLSYQQEINSYQLQMNLQNNAIQGLQKKWKQQKRKTFIVGLAGFLTTTGIAYLFIK